MSKRAKYVGGHDAVDIQPWRLDADGVATAFADDSVVTVQKGELTPVDVPDHFIDGLLEQPANWVEQKSPSKPAPADTESAASDAKE